MPIAVSAALCLAGMAVGLVGFWRESDMLVTIAEVLTIPMTVLLGVATLGAVLAAVLGVLLWPAERLLRALRSRRR